MPSVQVTLQGRGAGLNASELIRADCRCSLAPESNLVYNCMRKLRPQATATHACLCTLLQTVHHCPCFAVNTPVSIDSCQCMGHQGVVQDVFGQLAQLLRQQCCAQGGSMQHAIGVELCPVPINLHQVRQPQRRGLAMQRAAASTSAGHNSAVGASSMLLQFFVGAHPSAVQLLQACNALSELCQVCSLQRDPGMCLVGISRQLTQHTLGAAHHTTAHHISPHSCSGMSRPCLSLCPCVLPFSACM